MSWLKRFLVRKRADRIHRIYFSEADRIKELNGDLIREWLADSAKRKWGLDHILKTHQNALHLVRHQLKMKPWEETPPEVAVSLLRAHVVSYAVTLEEVILLAAEKEKEEEERERRRSKGTEDA